MTTEEIYKEGFMDAWLVFADQRSTQDDQKESAAITWDASEAKAEIETALASLSDHGFGTCIVVEGKSFEIIGGDEFELCVNSDDEAAFIPWEFVRAAIKGGAKLVTGSQSEQEEDWFAGKEAVLDDMASEALERTNARKERREGGQVIKAAKEGS